MTLAPRGLSGASGVIDMALLSTVRRWHFREPLSIREICRGTGLSRNVAWLIPALRQISATGTPSAPCFKMNAFCASKPKVRVANTSMPSSSSAPSSPIRLARKTPLLNDPLLGLRSLKERSDEAKQVRRRPVHCDLGRKRALPCLDRRSVGTDLELCWR